MKLLGWMLMLQNKYMSQSKYVTIQNKYMSYSYNDRKFHDNAKQIAQHVKLRDVI
jgi:hypothetical protein